MPIKTASANKIANLNIIMTKHRIYVSNAIMDALKDVLDPQLKTAAILHVKLVQAVPPLSVSHVFLQSCSMPKLLNVHLQILAIHQHI